MQWQHRVDAERCRFAAHPRFVSATNQADASIDGGDRMNAVVRLAVAFAAGAAAMYYFDPVAGRRRRAMTRDQGVAASHEVEDFARAKSKRAADRVHGAKARTRARLSDEPIDDLQLHERIRSKLGRLVDNASAVTVQVSDGHVVLSGHVSEEEVESVADAVASMRGVESVDNQLSVGSEMSSAETTSTGQDARH
jgi:hyperosmotically inducible periplasmic protein